MKGRERKGVRESVRADDWGDDSGLVSTAVLAYTLGLRHALDADHISVRCGFFYAVALCSLLSVLFPFGYPLSPLNHLFSPISPS